MTDIGPHWKLVETRTLPAVQVLTYAMVNRVSIPPRVILREVMQHDQRVVSDRRVSVPLHVLRTLLEGNDDQARIPDCRRPDAAADETARPA